MLSVLDGLVLSGVPFSYELPKRKLDVASLPFAIGLCSSV
jgi:hypothetical protein